MAGTLSSLGLGSGLPLQDILSQLRSADQVRIVNLQTRQLQYKDQLGEFGVVRSKLLAMKTMAFDLSLNDTFLSRSASSSDDTVFGATADSSASPATVEVTVSSLAKKDVWQSSAVAGATTDISNPSGSFVYTLDGTDYTVTVDAGMSLQELADAINEADDNPGVTASVMDDGTGSGTDYHLVLSTDSPGADNEISIGTNDTTLTWTHQQTAANSQVKINNITYERQSNSISDIVTGVTLNLEGTGTSTLTVGSDTGAVKNKILALFASYNEALQEIDANSGYDADTGVAGSLNGVSAFKNLRSTLNNILSTTVSGLGTEYGNLAEIGLSFDRSGLLSMDQSVLDAALASNLEDVQALFVGDAVEGIDGIATMLDDALVDITKSSGGLISSETERVQAVVDRLDDQIDRANDLLDARYALLEKQFVQLDSLLNNLQSQGSALSSTFKGLSDMWVKNN